MDRKDSISVILKWIKNLSQTIDTAFDFNTIIHNKKSVIPR
jgi:hypothetical protein